MLYSCKMGHCGSWREKGWSGHVALRTLTSVHCAGHWEGSELCFGLGEVGVEVQQQGVWVIWLLG